MPPIQLKKVNFSQFIPILNWLKNYTKQDFSSDIVAGIITTVLLIPQSMAYAMLAGLPVQMGLYASILPAVAYAFLGTSRTLSVGPASIIAIMIASVLSAPELNALGSPIENALILATESGLILLFMALLRMDNLINFVSRPVLTGFTSGAAILIVYSQIPHLLGLSANLCAYRINCYQDYVTHINVYTAGLGGISLLLFFLFVTPLSTLLKKLHIRQPIVIVIGKCASLVAVIITTCLVAVYQLDQQHNVAIVGQIELELPTLSVAFVTHYAQWQALLPDAFLIAIITYIGSVAIAKVTANLSDQKINYNQELVALGVANIMSAFSGGMMVSGAFSRTMVNFMAGAKTQIALLISVLLLSIAIVSLAEQFTYIPKTTLAVIIIVAIIPLIKLSDIYKTWQYDPSDGLSELITLLGVLIFGIKEGIIFGVTITILNYLHRTSRPHIALVGQIAGTAHFRNVKRHPVETWKNILLIRIDENISFANIGYIVNFIEQETSNKPNLNHLVLIFSSVSYVDVTAFEALKNLIPTLKNQAITLNLAEVKGPVMDKLKQTHFLEYLRPGKVFFQTIEAIEVLAVD